MPASGEGTGNRVRRGRPDGRQQQQILLTKWRTPSAENFILNWNDGRSPLLVIINAVESTSTRTVIRIRFINRPKDERSRKIDSLLIHNFFRIELDFYYCYI